MESANRYLDKIKASTELKEKTTKYIEDNLPDVRKLRRPSLIRKLAFAACAVFAFGAISVGGYAYYQKPVNYVNIDINPSVELGVNAFGRVVRVSALNEDGEKIVQNLSVKNKSVDDAVCAIVNEAVEQDFIADDGSSVVAITAQSANADDADELQNLGTAGANKALVDDNAYAAVLGESADFDLRAEAETYGVSPGKYKLIMMLKVLDPTIDVGDYADAKVSEIMDKAKELISQNENYSGNNGAIGNILGTVASYSEKSEQAKANAQSKGKGNGNSSSEQNKGTTKNTETERYTEQNGTTAMSGATNGSGAPNGSGNSNGNGGANGGNGNANSTPAGGNGNSGGTQSNGTGASAGGTYASSSVHASSTVGDANQYGRSTEPPEIGNGSGAGNGR